MKLNGKKVIIILSQHNFCDEEYQKSRAVFESSGINCSVASSVSSEVEGMEGLFVKPDLKISNVNIKNYNALCLIGGVGCTEYWHDKMVHNIAIQAWKAGILIGAICLAPIILANAGLLKGKRATAYYSASSYIEKRGVKYSCKPIEIEKNIITANGPEVAEAFARKMIEILK